MKKLLIALTVLGLTACGGGGSSKPKPPPVPVNQAPVANFAIECSNLDCTFTNSSSDSDGTVASQAWNFGDGNTSTEASPSHIFASDGTYTVQLTVKDNDGASGSKSQSVTVSTPSLSIADASLVEGDDGTTNMVFTVTLSNLGTSNVTVDYATSDNTATSADYNSNNGTLTFTPGTQTQTIAVSVMGDILYADEDGDETFNVTLSNGSVPITDATAVGTITNDDMTKKEAYDQLYEINVVIDAQRPSGSSNVNIDLDGDDDIDVLLTFVESNDHDNKVIVLGEAVILRNLLGNGFVSENTGLRIKGRDWTVKDFNGDGLDDIVFAEHGYDYTPFPGHQDYFIIQNSNGTLSDVTATKMPQQLDFSHGICAADFDNNGFVDTFITEGSQHKKLMNNGTELIDTLPITNYEQLSWYYAEEIGLITSTRWDMVDLTFWMCETSDVNNDGHIDVILGGAKNNNTNGVNDLDGNSLINTHVILLNDGNGDLTYDFAATISYTATTYVNSAVIFLEVAELSSDTCEDFISVYTNYTDAGGLQVFSNNCDGTFTETQTVNRPIGYEWMDKTVDLNGDGVTDFIFFNGEDKHAYIINGDGTLTQRDITEAEMYKMAPSEFLYMQKWHF